MRMKRLNSGNKIRYHLKLTWTKDRIRPDNKAHPKKFRKLIANQKKIVLHYINIYITILILV